MTPLFAYGTFRRTAWRREILGADYPCQPATLAGFRRVTTPSGYLSLRTTVVALARIEGVVIELDDAGWAIADAWEDVPAYERVTVTVATMNGPLEVQTYVYAAHGEELLPVDDERYASLDDGEVEASIAAFEPTMRRIRARYAP